ncbi:hypothetical protein [Ectopseudomonas oleovorans]|jgi:hypothetical protein|uniref:hypothetical protein n=1 Tax=Ectopseudomonas oleovorans TaxID=301 RepID=UPI00241C41E3|nr:hypothetical protein [Pseudomonas oleovorans]
MQNNIEKFNYLVGVIFASLYRSFPCRVRIEYLEIIGASQCPETIDEAGNWTGIYIKDGELKNLTEELEFLHETLQWLYETGYLIGSVGLSHGGRYATVTLSPKGLEILKIVPNSISPESSGKSIADELSEALNASAKEQVGEIAGKALSYLFKIGWGSLAVIG